MPRYEFAFGDDPAHTACIDLNLFNGKETYSIDGLTVLECRSFAVNTARRFSLPGDESTACECVLQQFPYWKVHVYANGELISDNPFPVRQTIDRVLNWSLLVGFLLLLVLIQAIFLMRFLP